MCVFVHKKKIPAGSSGPFGVRLKLTVSFSPTVYLHVVWVQTAAGRKTAEEAEGVTPVMQSEGRMMPAIRDNVSWRFMPVAHTHFK